MAEYNARLCVVVVVHVALLHTQNYGGVSLVAAKGVWFAVAAGTIRAARPRYGKDQEQQ